MTSSLVALSVAILAAVAVLVWPSRSMMNLRRLIFSARREAYRPVRIGIAASLSAMSAAVRNGSSLSYAVEEQGGLRFSTPTITVWRAERVLRRRAEPEERDGVIAEVARQLTAACVLSRELGGGAAKCLDAVAATYRRARLMRDRKREVLAGPQASVRLLTALPVLTVMAGEALGARSLQWLTGSNVGLMCLVAGVGLYAGGLLWMRRLIHALDVGTNNGQGRLS